VLLTHMELDSLNSLYLTVLELGFHGQFQSSFVQSATN
jgi:hypothetical protein